MSRPDRSMARELARRHLDEGDALGWFESLYAASKGDATSIPWADLTPNPNLVCWLDARPVLTGGRAIKIGCGLGDDAEELARRGFDTVAFDISATAVSWCRRRFPESVVGYVVADLLRPPAGWTSAYDLVLESYTLQVLPPGLRREAMLRAGGFVAEGGTLLVISRGREPDDPPGEMPWPLTREELGVFSEAGLSEARFEDFVDAETPPVRRFRVAYTRPSSG